MNLTPLALSEVHKLPLPDELRARLLLTLQQGLAPEPVFTRIVQRWPRRGGVFTGGPFEGLEVARLDLAAAEHALTFARWACAQTGGELILVATAQGYEVLESPYAEPRRHATLAAACDCLVRLANDRLEAL